MAEEEGGEGGAGENSRKYNFSPAPKKRPEKRCGKTKPRTQDCGNETPKRTTAETNPRTHSSTPLARLRLGMG